MFLLHLMFTYYWILGTKKDNTLSNKKESLECDLSKSDGEAPILEIWWVLSYLSLLLITVPVWWVIEHAKIQSEGQIHLYKNCSYSIWPCAERKTLNKWLYQENSWFGLGGFYSISIIVGYLMPLSVFTYTLNMDADVTYWEKAWRKLHKNGASYIEQILEATFYVITFVRPPTSYLEKSIHMRRTCGTLYENQVRIHKWSSPMDVFTWMCKYWPTKKDISTTAQYGHRI